MTHEQRLEQQRIRRRLNGNSETHKYEKTPNGFLMRLYRNMESRVTGVQKKKAHLYKGKELLPRDQFYRWSLNNPDFYALYTDWRRADYDRHLTPTVDRVDSSAGYTLANMRWLTHSENSRLGSISKNKSLSSTPSSTHGVKTDFTS